MKMNDATRAQIIAARPDHSTWLSANAGSGKTRVLTDRVARLLLDGTQPQHILCLTYTKAAASEMQNRLLDRLGKWAMLPDAELRDQLSDLGLDGADTRLDDARRLFARAIETPGGLKIQTIHSFCAALLRRFPLEAGVSPQFTEMDDRAAQLLRAEIVEEMSDGDDAPLVTAVARYVSDTDFATLTGQIVNRADQFGAEAKLGTYLKRFGLTSNFQYDDIPSITFDGTEKEIAAALEDLCSGQSKTYVTFASDLRSALIAHPSCACLEPLQDLFLYKSDDKNGRYNQWDSKSRNFPQSNHKKAVEALTPILPDLHEFMDRVHQSKMAEFALLAAEKAYALHSFANRFLGHYARAKQARGWLDFDDLINLTRHLLTDDTVAAWVLYRLDGGIDHILVDEAQDTSPAQWQVIERLAQEFTAGMGARTDVTRTIFVVGDKKQSIYSFQGADPRAFDQMREDFGRRLADTPTPLNNRELLYSFRSSDAILSLVDEVFRSSEPAGFTPDSGHRAFHQALPGRVDLWPVVAPQQPEDDTPWFTPIDLRDAEHHNAILAREIAGEIHRMIGEKVQILLEQGRNRTTSRPVHGGDFLILVQRRSDLFHAIIRECKALGLPIAGADRLRLGGEMAVRDLGALLAFLATPEDDLSLASVLRSPLFGWSEQALFTLANPRTGYLWEALREHAADHPETIAILDDLRRHADFLRPFELIERMLTRHDGRRRLLARLGAEAEEGIDALLAQALAYERFSVPSLTGFLIWMQTDDPEIKRQVESVGTRIRVMTVHGSKGLEAPIVILPDTAKRQPRNSADILPTPDGPVWTGKRADQPPAIQDAMDAKRLRDEQERERLLYVAMTRAEKWLIVAGAGDLGSDGAAWHDRIRAGLETKGAVDFDTPTGLGLRFEHGDWAMSETDLAPPSAPDIPDLPDWATTRAPIPDPRPKPLSPSDLGGAKALPGDMGLDEGAAKRRGRQVHRLLEYLPAHDTADWPATAATLLSNGPDAAGPDEIAQLLTEVTRVLTRPGLAHIFEKSALAEVPITANLAELNGRRIHGIIDRLIIQPDRIVAVDFKTNATVPDDPRDVPAGLLRQMGAYAAALGQIYDRPVETALLWTRNATLMPLSHDLVMGALRDTAIP